jgi:lysophospholipase L1-like esterase
VVALGDSVTVGVGDRVVDGDPLGWSAHLARMIGAPCFTNLSRTGARARDVLAEQLAPALATHAQVATLLVGGNDVLRADFHADRVAADVRAACDALVEAGMTVLVVLLHDPGQVLPGGGGVFGRVIAARADLVNAAIHAALDGRSGVVLFDPRTESSTYERVTWHIDRMHPSPLGHRVLASHGAGALARAGVVQVASMPQVPEEEPGIWAHAVWLIRNGVPWFAKRSLDLVPELVRVVISERRRGVGKRHTTPVRSLDLTDQPPVATRTEPVAGPVP